jgi:hypothetical protein
LKLGLFMMPIHPPERAHSDAYELDIETLVAADRLGYDEVREPFTRRPHNAYWAVEGLS